MDAVGEGLRQFFAAVVYPAVVVLTCFVVFATVFLVAARARTARAIVAAIVPIITLPFLVVAHASVGDPVMHAVGRLYESARFGLGMAAAVVLIETGQFLLRRSNEIGPALFILILGFAGTFFVYALMGGALPEAQFVFFGFTVGGGIYMVFRGVPLPERMLRDWPFGTTVSKSAKNMARSISSPNAEPRTPSTHGRKQASEASTTRSATDPQARHEQNASDAIESE